MLAHRLCRTRTPRTRGQSLVEFAFVAVVLTLLAIGATDFARALSAYIDIGNAARAGAQAGTIAGRLGATDETGMFSIIEDAAKAEQAEIFDQEPDVDTPVVAADASGACYVQVTVTYDFEPIVSFPFSSLRLSRTATMRMLQIPTSVADKYECTA